MFEIHHGCVKHDGWVKIGTFRKMVMAVLYYRSVEEGGRHNGNVGFVVV